MWSADEKHRNILLEEWGLLEANAVELPMTSGDDDILKREERPPMPPDRATAYRRAVARLNYLGLDRPDVALAANRLSRCMAAPREGDEKPLKRILRYLRGRPDCSLYFPWQPMPQKLDVCTDSDWAGCKITRRSTSGTLVRAGQHILCFASKLQKICSP